MTEFSTLRLPDEPTALAPDGSEVRVLLGVSAGGMAHFRLAEGMTSRAIEHRTVEELWYVLEGRAEMWRSQAGKEETRELAPDTCVSIPLGTKFQFRSLGPGPFSAVAVTMPPWPGAEEAVFVEGPWASRMPVPR